MVVGQFERSFAAGAEARAYFEALSARLKSCPDTSCSPRAALVQPVKLVHFELTHYRLAGFPRACLKNVVI